MIFIYITCQNKKEAEKIGKYLLNKKLVACINIFPIESFYWWKGKIEKSKEFVLILKTLENKYNKILKEVEKLHSYTIPFIGQIKISKVNKKYLNWLKNEIR